MLLGHYRPLFIWCAWGVNCVVTRTLSTLHVPAGLFLAGTVVGSAYTHIKHNSNEWEKTRLGLTRSAGGSGNVDGAVNRVSCRTLRSHPLAVILGIELTLADSVLHSIYS